MYNHCIIFVIQPTACIIKEPQLKKFMKLIPIACLILILTFFGCQATPDKPAVVNKNDGKLEEIINTAPNTESEQITNIKKWEEQYSIHNLECKISADVILPDTVVFPVFEIKKFLFNAEFTDNILKYFTRGATGVRETSTTKEELTAQLIAAKRGVYVEDDKGARWEEYEGQQQRIAELEEQIKNASSEVFGPIQNAVIPVPFDNTYSMPTGAKIFVSASEKQILINTEKYGVIQGESWLKDGGAIPGEKAGATIDNIKINKDRALQILNAFISDIGIKDYGIASVEKARIVYVYTAEVKSKGWEFILTKNLGNSIPVDLTAVQAGSLLDFSSDDYMERWKQDTITVYIDEIGIQYFCWTEPVEVTKTINENVSLLPFSEVKNKIKSNIKFAYSKSIKNGWMKGKNFISVNKILLTNLPIPVKNDTEHQILSPAWLVFINFDIYYNHQIIDKFTSIFAVNAIDGSNIDLSYHRQRHA